MKICSRAEKTVLVVDDAAEMRALYSAGLTLFGYKVDAVESSTAAIALLGQRNVHAIVTDFWMPRMTGLAMASTIRSDARHYHIPISLISSAPPSSVDSSLFTRVLRKPCAFDDLLETVDQMCFGAN